MSSNYQADLIEQIRAGFSSVAPQLFPERLTIRIPGTTTPDGFGGTTDSEPTEYANIPGKIEPLGRSDQAIGGAQITNQTHKIKMGVTAITRKITTHYQIIRQAQGDQESETYENPVGLLGSTDVLMKVAAALKG